ncbi:hypothetical protein AURDEDRAFT_155196 [Auricularia subglabra TFB-10046 SS5]|nr:hypothetical protein AURDEDRAFT_155196 [Auricularia subglabra TFB-10046 SS5]
MRFVSLATALIIAVTAAAHPTNSTSYKITGPLPYAELKLAVAQLHHAEGKRSLDKRLCEGVYLCAGRDFTGECYWACYPISTAIYPDAYWVPRIESVGPDQGGWCDFFGGSVCEEGPSQPFEYPGGNLEPPVANAMGCFYCNPAP